MASVTPCANCSNPAHFTQSGVGIESTSWCSDHLPPFLRVLASQGLLPLQETPEADTPSATPDVTPDEEPKASPSK